MNVIRGLICLALAGALSPCWAALGENASSVAADSARMKGALRSSSTAAFTVHEISTPTSTVVREYVGPDGQVFAVSWRGPFNPNLKDMFGAYYTQYQQAAAAGVGHDKRHSQVSTPELIVQRSGRLRGFAGRAWLTQRLPANVTPSDIE